MIIWKYHHYLIFGQFLIFGYYFFTNQMYLLGLRRPLNMKMKSIRSCKLNLLCQKRSWNRFSCRVCCLFRPDGKPFGSCFSYFPPFGDFDHFSVRIAQRLFLPFFNQVFLIFIKIIIIVRNGGLYFHFLGVGRCLIRYGPQIPPKIHKSA